MLCFVQQLLYFCTSEVIEPNWAAFMSRLKVSEDLERTSNDEERPGSQKQDIATPFGASARPASAASKAPLIGAAKRTVDELMQDHVDFLATCLKECMLTNSKLLRVCLLVKIRSICPAANAMTRSTQK